MELESTRVFVKVVQLGSFSKAAAVLQLPKSTVSRTISRLEAETGTQLLLRTTRSLKLTASGQAFYESCVDPIRALEDARRSLQGQDSIITGLVKITAPEDMGAFAVSPVIGKLTRLHPDLSFELNYTDEIVDLVKEGYDLAIRLGKLNPSRFKATKLGENVLIPVASPRYLAGKSKIRDPMDLQAHDCLSIFSETATSRWTLASKGRSLTVSVQARTIGNQMTSLMNIALEGGGVALVPRYLCQAELKAGRLVRLLPEWSAPGLSVWLVSPRSSGMPARVKLVAEELSVRVREILKGA